MLHLLLYCCLLFLPTVSQEDEEPSDPDLAAKLAKFENAKQASSDSSNQAPAPAGVQIDWNKPWRFKYANSTNITADWRVSCTGFRPVCRAQDLMDGDDIADMNKNTAKMGNSSTSLGELNYFCNENRLEKETVMLSAGASWESTYVMWIGAILMQELLQIPVTIRENMGASHQFYLRKEPRTQRILPTADDSLNKIDKSRFTGLEVANENLNCDPLGLKNLSTMPEYDGHPNCKGRFKGDSVPTKCKPCQHAILDVWGGAADELSRLVRVTEPGGPLGLVSSQGWYISSDVARMHPELASYRGLMNSNLTNQIFKRPVTFGEFCYGMRKRTKGRGREWDRSFCRMFYSYHGFIQYDYCANNPHFYIELGVVEYYLCTLYIVTVDDLWEYSPFSASDLEIYALCPICPRVMNGIDPLYRGKFVELGSEAYPGEPVNPVATQTGPLVEASYRDLELPGGKEIGGYLMHSGCTARGDPGGGKWAYDLPTMLQVKDRTNIMKNLQANHKNVNEYLPLKLTPYDMGDNTFRAWEIANRHRDGSLPQIISDNDLGSIIYHYRPHPVFQRYKYNITGFERPCGEQTGGICKYNRMGEPYKLTAVTMPAWNEKCYNVRKNQTNHCLKENNATTTKDVNIDGYPKEVDGPCGYRIDNVFKLFVGRLREHSPEGK